MDRASLVAGYANIFNDAVKAATAAYTDTSRNAIKAADPKPIDNSKEELVVHLTPEAIAKYYKLDDPDKVIETALMSQ